MRRCCVSKARAAPASIAHGGGGMDGALAAELSQLKLSQLRRRAREAASISEERIDQADDGDDPRAALVALLLEDAASATNAASAGGDGSQAAVLRAELRGLKPSALRKRAHAAGVDKAALDEAGDGPAPVEAIIELICRSAEPAEPITEAEDPAMTQLRAELSALKLKALKMRARDEGVSEELLDDADDADDIRAAVIQLTLSATAGRAGDNREARQALQSELAALKLKALKKRARASGVSQAKLDDADDADDIRSDVIELIVSAELDSDSSLDKDRPHFGDGRAVSSATPPAGRGVQPTKHVMLSYQWDHQTQVKRAYDILTKLGVKCWMDIAGGMSGDIFESMANAVSNASVVVCFMSQKYQESNNCMLEVKFARQSGVEIIPVIMEGGGWRASGWLGLITAGSLWVRLSDESQFDDSMRQLYSQIEQKAGAGVLADSDVSDEGVASAMEAKEELARLREDLEAKTESQAVTAVLADPSQPATIPAGVPKLPARFQSTEQIAELTRLVLSTRASEMRMPRVGFWGMGGIGKTVTGAAIVRNDDVRLHFHAIIWLPLGQTPVISKLQNLCHMQCTGKELSAELSSDEKKEALQQAMKGKRVLLCLDDLWEEDHELELNFVDVSVGSKVLISTRMKVLLDGGHQVEVGLPSPSDSARMLLAAAGVGHMDEQPTGVHEIVDLCGRLPLALGIAGRLAASLGLVDTEDWSDMIGVLKEELRANHSSGVQEGMIRASLRGLKGSATEQANVKSLLLLFGLVPEDTHCPLEVLLLMFNAVYADVGATMMHLRKWLRILISRSLVLGTVDRSSVHDLVLDFAVAQRTQQELQDGHRAIVEAFRKARPLDFHGRPMYDPIMQDESVHTSYVCVEGFHHVQKGWEADMEHDDHALSAMLGDCPQDALVLHAGGLLGVDWLVSAAERAETRGDWWMAGRYFAIASALKRKTDGSAVDLAHRSLDTLARCVDESNARMIDDINDIQLAMYLAISIAGDMAGIAARSDGVEATLSSQAAFRDPVSTNVIRVLLHFPLIMAGEIEAVNADRAANALTLAGLCATHPDPRMRHKCGLLAYAWPHIFDSAYVQPKFSWDSKFGTDGSMLLDVTTQYDYSRDHAAVMLSLANGDFLHTMGGNAFPFILHYGNVELALSQMEQSFDVVRRILEEPDQQLEMFAMGLGVAVLGHMAVACELPIDRREAVAAVMVESGNAWDTADSSADLMASSSNWTRARGDRTRNAGPLLSAEHLSWCLKCGYLLNASRPTLTKAEVTASLPGVDEITDFVQVFDMVSAHGLFNSTNLFVYIAQVLEQFGEHEETLLYTAAALETDHTKAGTQLPSDRINAYLIQGRAFAALGLIGKAAAAFESAAGDAHRYGFFLWEVFALRDLKLLVLDDMGHSEHGSRRLGASLRQLTGPASMLSPMLKGLDAPELMALPPPDRAYRVVFEEASPRQQELRNELQELKVGALSRRAVTEGVTSDELDVAEDSADPKAATIELILTVRRAAAAEASDSEAPSLTPLAEGEAGFVDHLRNGSASQRDQEAAAQVHRRQNEEVDVQADLRQELRSLRLGALSKRAMSGGVDQDAIEDAMESDTPKAALVDLILAQLPQVDEANWQQQQAFREELSGLRLMAISKRAQSEGVDAEAIEDAMESAEPKSALIELILACKPAELPAPPAQHDSFRSELSGLRLKELRARAKAEDVDAGLLDAAMDNDEPKEAVIQLLLDVKTAAERARKELESLRLKELRSRAKAAGHSAELLEEAMDDDEPKAAVIELLLSPAPRVVAQPREPEPEPTFAISSAPKATDQAEHPVYRALEAHQLEAHFDKLLELGVKRVEDLEQLSQADVNELEMKKFDRAKFVSAFLTETPHHSMLSAASTAVAAAGGFSFEGDKHCMFSYQWDNQHRVLDVREHFAKLGIPTWMDVDGGMQVDIYDSMAQGVSKAAVVIAFMSQRYQDSENCRLELKYAKTKGVPIVPVMVQGGGWRASEWLGIITAGALWTPLYDETAMQQNLQAVVDQIKAAAPTTAMPASAGRLASPRVTPIVSSGESEEVQALRSELDSLRQKLTKERNQRAAADDTTTAAAAATATDDSASGVLAPIPGEVPPLSLNCRPTTDMEKLKAMLISTDSDDRTMAVTSQKSLSTSASVGALGMGGIGKTVTASWLARDEDVRRHFELVVWVTLGQTPDLDRMRGLIHLQVTGEELAAGSTPEQAKELITVAMRGRSVLLVLDDIWEEEHSAALDFIDTSTASKTLVTTRIRGLGGAAQVELGVPTEEESIKMLLASAGLAHLSSAPPAECKEVVAICGRLPLCLDLAGRMLRDLGVVGGTDWEGIPKLLKQEMQAGAADDETTVEYRVIAASLSAIPLRDREDVKKVFSVFAVVSEDTYVPLAAFRIILSAVTGEAELVPELQLRKWVQVLINRSLVLGTWERYLIAQHTPEQLQELQRKVVDAFAAQRPVSPDPRLCGMRHWTVDVSDDSSVYVKKEMENHVKAGVGHITEGGELIPYVQDWLSHYPDLIYPDLISPDLITRAVGAVMGADKSMQIAHKAAANENWWLAYAACFAWMLSMHAAGESAEMYSGQHSDGMTMFMNSFLRVDMQQPACLTKMQYEHWRLGAYMVFNNWVESAGIDAARNIYPTLTAEDAQRWSDSIPKLLETTDAGRAHPETPESWTNKIVMAKALKTDDWDTHDPIWLEDWQQKLRTAQKDGKGMIDLLQQLCGNQAVIRLPQWSWDHLSGDEVLAAMQGRDWALERLHYDDKAYNLACLGGDIPYMTATLDFARDNVKRLAAESEGPLSLRAMWLVASHCYPWVLRLLGRTQEAKSLMEQADLTWTSADASVDSYAESRDPGVRNRGAKPGPSDVFQVTAEDFSWSIRLQYVLCSTWRECPPDDVIADLPSPDTLVSYVTNIATRGTTGPGHGKHHRAGVRNLLLLAAEVCEKLERPDDALLYVAKALNNDPKDPYSDRRPTTQALGHSLRGRVLASQGKAAEAEAAFEEAVQAAHSKEMWLFEMLALRDLKVHVLDKDGRGEEGLRRLKVVLKEMKGAPAELTKLLGGGLDAEEILRHS